MMGFDYRKLRGKIKEVCNTQANFAAAIGLGRTSLNQRLNNILDFSQSEMEKTAEVLGFRKEDIPTYFLSRKFRNTNYPPKVQTMPRPGRTAREGR